MAKLPKHLYIVGPTGVGKTEFSLLVSQALGWPIFNCDSIQMYQLVNIGSAKPSLQQRQVASHYLFDFVPPPEVLTASRYLKEVLVCIKGKNISDILFVGGSGFYIQALQRGLYPVPEVSEGLEKKIQDWIDSEGFSSLYAWIQKKDPLFSNQISSNDEYRIRRSVELMMIRKKTMTQIKKHMDEKSQSPLPPNECLKVGLGIDRTFLKERIEKRTKKMLASGWLEEVEGLLARGLSSWPPLSSVGYKECVSYIKGGMKREDLVASIVTGTMQMAKKQMTWFKKDRSIHWFDESQSRQALDFVLNKADLKNTA